MTGVSSEGRTHNKRGRRDEKSVSCTLLHYYCGDLYSSCKVSHLLPLAFKGNNMVIAARHGRKREHPLADLIFTS